MAPEKRETTVYVFFAICFLPLSVGIACSAMKKHDLLFNGLLGNGGIQSQELQRVVEQGPADGDAGLAVAHAIVQCDDLLLRIRTPRVRADFQRDVSVPVGILAGVRVTGAAVPDAKDARQ